MRSFPLVKEQSFLNEFVIPSIQVGAFAALFLSLLRADPVTPPGA